MPDFDLAYKPKLVNTKSGILIAVYGDAVEDNPEHYIYDLQADTLRPARVVFVRVCNSGQADCSQMGNWSSPINISNTASHSSVSLDWRSDGNRLPYYGDAGNPHAFAAGSYVAVSWVDMYCTGVMDRAG